MTTRRWWPGSERAHPVHRLEPADPFGLHMQREIDVNLIAVLIIFLASLVIWLISLLVETLRPAPQTQIVESVVAMAAVPGGSRRGRRGRQRRWGATPLDGDRPGVAGRGRLRLVEAVLFVGCQRHGVDRGVVGAWRVSDGVVGRRAAG